MSASDMPQQLSDLRLQREHVECALAASTRRLGLKPACPIESLLALCSGKLRKESVPVLSFAAVSAGPTTHNCEGRVMLEALIAVGGVIVVAGVLWLRPWVDDYRHPYD